MPSNLEPGHTYLRVTTTAPKDLDLSGSGDSASIVYVGPVGELPDEHVFEVKTKEGQVIDPAGHFWSSQGPGVVDGLKGKGIKAEVLAHKQRAKRDEF